MTWNLSRNCGNVHSQLTVDVDLVKASDMARIQVQSATMHGPSYRDQD